MSRPALPAQIAAIVRNINRLRAGELREVHGFQHDVQRGIEEQVLAPLQAEQTFSVMAAELSNLKIDPESHLLLDQPLLKVPYELARKNFKSAQRHVERERDALLTSLKAAANGSSTSSIANGADNRPASSSSSATNDPAAQALESLDAMINRMETLKRKLTALHTEEELFHRQSRRRIEHLQALHECHSLADVKYDEWSKIRLNRLLVDYMLRCGHGESAKALAKENGIEELVDVEAFVQCHKVEASLMARRTQEALSWCADNKQSLKKMNSDLEFELRLQQFIELVRGQKLHEATTHGKKYLAGHHDTQQAIRAAGLLAFGPDTVVEPYATLYSPNRWATLAALFLKTHHELLSLPTRPALHVALSAGLSALKTPSCHSAHASSSSNANTTITNRNSGAVPGAIGGGGVCPICSTELNELARDVPYANHTKSSVENDPIILPNGRLYGRERLVAFNMKMPPPKGMVRDPTNPEEVFGEGEMKKVFIS